MSALESKNLELIKYMFEKIEHRDQGYVRRGAINKVICSDNYRDYDQDILEYLVEYAPNSNEDLVPFIMKNLANVPIIDDILNIICEYL